MVRMIPDLLEQLTTRFAISLFRDFPIITVRRNPLDELQWRFVKRTADIVFSLVFLVCFASWLFPLIAVAIKLTSPGPVFFKQERLGKKGRRIFCYKFRSMAARSSDTDLQGAYRQAVRGDSRITPLGRILRKTNLDETPQFFNVLFGQMSLVGPRPHPLPLNEKSVNEVDRYLLRHLVKPGITGWAQVHGLRGGTEHPDLMRKRIEHDIWYIENWSFALDLNICTLTLLNAFAGEKNAY
jgi:putative colanic acid biosynthesis UDP-glucose lipid carrier transferase